MRLPLSLSAPKTHSFITTNPFTTPLPNPRKPRKNPKNRREEILIIAIEILEEQKLVGQSGFIEGEAKSTLSRFPG